MQSLIYIALILHCFELRSVNRCICAAIKRTHIHLKVVAAIKFSLLGILCGATSIHVFYECRDNPIQYHGSNFVFNCSNTSEVIYVQSAIIGFTSKYRADNNVFECPITADTCTNATKEPSTLCDGLNKCTMAQRVLLYKISGLKCSLNGATAASD